MKVHTLRRAGLQGGMGSQAVNHRGATGNRQAGTGWHRQAQASTGRQGNRQAGTGRQTQAGQAVQAGCWFPPMTGGGRDPGGRESASLHTLLHQQDGPTPCGARTRDLWPIRPSL